jgi:pimeloyl-ACP methyl ester carboxylesterase
MNAAPHAGRRRSRPSAGAVGGGALVTPPRSEVLEATHGPFVVDPMKIERGATAGRTGRRIRLSVVPRPPAASSPRRRLRISALLLVAVAVAAIAATAADRRDAAISPRAEAPAPFVAGSGARSAQVLPRQGRVPRPTVVFLHGWGLTGPTAYRPWLRHLTARGSTVIVPRYQTSLRTRSEAVPDNALAGLRSALRRLRPRPRAVVVVGHSVGGILAVDYAVRARELGLPPALAVMSVFPGGALRDVPPIPEDNLANLPSTVRRLLVLASPTDQIVGTAPAQAIFDAAVSVPEGRRRLVLVDDPVAGDHFAPVLDSPAARRTFWSPLDRILSLVG